MKITVEILDRFAPCRGARNEFAERFPDGLDISSLWGTSEQASKTWHMILSDRFLKQHVGWAISEGLLPARIRADLSGANLSGANLSGANLYGANLSGANLYGANLYGANLRDADLRGADLRGAYLSGANLRDANPRGAYLSGAYLRGANLSGAYLRGAYLSGANHNCYTTWPDGFEVPT